MSNVEVDVWANPVCAFHVTTHARPASGPKGRQLIGPAARPGKVDRIRMSTEGAALFDRQANHGPVFVRTALQSRPTEG
jgi:hypothetical protein